MLSCKTHNFQSNVSRASLHSISEANVDAGTEMGEVQSATPSAEPKFLETSLVQHATNTVQLNCAKSFDGLFF